MPLKFHQSIIFLKNHNHSEFIAQRFDIAYPHLTGQKAGKRTVQKGFAPISDKCHKKVEAEYTCCDTNLYGSLNVSVEGIFRKGV